MKKTKTNFEIFYYYYPRKADGTCVYERFDIMYSSFRCTYVNIISAIKKAYRKLNKKGYEFAVGIYEDGQTKILYRTPGYKMLDGHIYKSHAFLDVWIHQKYTTGVTIAQSNGKQIPKGYAE